MSPLVWVLLVAFAVALFLLFGAVIEMYRALEQVRADAGLLDSRARISIELGSEPIRSSGLPAEVADHERAVVLIMSDSCGTCQELASHLGGDLPEGAWLVLAPRSAKSGEQWLSRYGLSGVSRVLVDDHDRITSNLGIRITPAVVRVRSAAAVAAHTLPSRRRLEEELRWLREGGPDQPSYGPVHQSHDLVTRELETISKEVTS